VVEAVVVDTLRVRTEVTVVEEMAHVLEMMEMMAHEGLTANPLQAIFHELLLQLRPLWIEQLRL
jgi:hypothetical protein